MAKKKPMTLEQWQHGYNKTIERTENELSPQGRQYITESEERDTKAVEKATTK